MSASETKYRETMLKKVIAIKDIKSGEQIKYEDVCFKRADSNNFIHSSDFISLITGGGKLKAKNNINSGDIISKNNIENLC